MYELEIMAHGGLLFDLRSLTSMCVQVPGSSSLQNERKASKQRHWVDREEGG